MNRRMGGRFILSALVVCLYAAFQSATAQVRINEFLADNVGVNPDNCDYDDFTDWIELHNTGAAEADIGGYTLTGDLKQPKKWTIPSGTVIPSKGYLLIWADGKNDKPGTKGTRPWYNTPSFTTKRYHASFKLDKEGEQVGLFDSQGKVVDSVTFGKQFSDVSMGRTSDGKWAKFDEPTPGAENTTTAKQSDQFSGTVAFSVEGGYYGAAQNVALTASDGSGIYYTLDGSIPYASDKKYAGPISVSKTTVVRARCIAADKLAGKVITNSYFIGEKARKLMVVSISTDPAFLFDKDIGLYQNSLKDREAPVSLEFITTDGKRVVRTNAGIRLGSFTNFGSDIAQKPFQLALRKRYGDEFVNYQFFTKPITKFDRFRLREGGDVWNSSIINDALLDPICTNQMEVGIQAFRETVVYINGEYFGLFDLREQFKDMYYSENYGVDPTKRDEVRNELIVSGGGIFGGGLGKTGMMGGSVEHWVLMYGSWDTYKTLTSLVKSSSFNYTEFKNQVDINSLADWACLVEFGKAISWGHNEDLWKVPGGKWRWVVTDFDRGWVIDDGFTKISHNTFTTSAGSSGSLVPNDTVFAKALNNADFKNFFAQRFAAHLNSTFNSDRLVTITDSVAGILSGEMGDHCTRWGSKGGVKSISAWQSEVKLVKEFFTDRPAYVWQHLAAAPISMGGTANLTVNVAPAVNGEIFIQGVRMSQGLTGLKFFKSVPLTLKAVPKKGCTFKSWGGGASGTNAETSITLSGDQTVTATFEGTPLPVNASPVRETGSILCNDHAFASNGSVALAVDFAFENSDHAAIDLYNLSGQKLYRLFDANMKPGAEKVRVTSRKLPAGVYFYAIKTNAYTRTNLVTVR